MAAGRLDRFGFIDPFDGGRVRLGTLATYCKRALPMATFSRSTGSWAARLFDLYSNFTFFLEHYLPTDPIKGDEIQQHDSRLQEGFNTQYLHPYHLFGHSSLLTLGSNFHDNQINVGLNQTIERRIQEVHTSAHAHVTNVAGYAQQGMDFLHQRVHFDAGLRIDYFRFDVNDHLVPADSGVQGASYVDSAPHSVANSGLTLTDWHGFNGSLRYRHVSKYILDGSDRTVPKATGLDVIHLSTSKRIRHGLDFNFAIDNVNNKRFYETQNYFPGVESDTRR